MKRILRLPELAVLVRWHSSATLLAAGSALLVAVGLWVSFRRTFAQWGVDSDTADMVMLWEGWLQFGWSFLRSWYYTQDNWLLSLMPFSFAAFSVLGTRPFLVVVMGWLIFVGCVGLTTLLAWRTAGRAAALWLAPLLMLSGQPVLGKVGFFTYPVTHNISLLWGLLAFYAALRWLSGKAAAWLAVVAVALLVNAASDPWSTAAFLLPTLVASSLIFLLPRDHGERTAAAALAVVVLVVGLLLETRLFGLLRFVAETEFATNDWAGLNGNLATLGQVLPLMFSTYPGLTTPWALTTLTSYVLLSALLIGALPSAMGSYQQMGIEGRFLLLASVLSCGGVISAFLIGRFPPGLYAERLIINVYVLLSLLLISGLVRAPVSHWARRVGAAAALTMMFTGAVTESRAWRQPVRINTFGALELARFLEQNGLRYGYGAYWGTQSNAVTWLRSCHKIIASLSNNRLLKLLNNFLKSSAVTL